nr:FKBP-type peptidyl-prolyl cis-trans isomerase [uncultured Pedobacter sp.]
MIKKILSLSIFAILALGACKKETRSLIQVEDETIQAYLKSNNLTGFTKDTSGFYYKVLTPGTGVAVAYPSYVGVYQTTTSINKNVTYEFSKYNPQFNYLGYITPVSWRESLLKIKKGGEIRVITPSYLAYGKDGSGSSIPGNAILDTKLNLIDDADRPAYEDALIRTYLTENNLTATKDANGIFYQIITPGTGTAITSTTASLQVEYTLRFLTGSIFQQTTSGSPVTLNISNTVDGWKLALPLIKAGGKIRLFIPSRFAYGVTGKDGIPPNTILDFDIDLISVTN